MWRIVASRPLGVEDTREIVKVECQTVRLVRRSRSLDEPWEACQPLDEIEFAGIDKD